MTPSKMRRQGREAFAPGADSEAECPYKKDWQSWDRENWLEGWHEAEDTCALESDAEPDVETRLAPEDCSLCPLCDNSMLDWDETKIIKAHGMQMLVHASCVEEG